jgi:hypothetical protein
MLWWSHFHRSKKVLAAAIMLLAMTLTAIPFQWAYAIITGDVGNRPIHDPGWPNGAAAICNNPARIAFWEGPLLGGPRHFEYRGDAKTFNAVLSDFAKLDVKTKRVVVHDGIKNSIWSNTNNDHARQVDARVDWIFMVWKPAYWEDLKKLPIDLNPIGTRDFDKGPPAQIDVYTGGNLRWSDVTMPEGIELIDERLEAHSCTPADGVVLEGKVIDLATNQPLAAKMLLQRMEQEPKGERRYTVASEVVTDRQGRWVLKKSPEGWHRVVVEADGYVPRVAGYVQYDQPGWHFYDCGLLRPASVAGRITDDAGQPLADVKVQLWNVGSNVVGRYESTHEYASQTGADGRFIIDQIPVGSAMIRLRKSGYSCPGLGQTITTPAKDVELDMIKSARLHITVDFAGADHPAGYMVEIKPEGGSAVGKWGGSGNIDANNQFSFEDVPPGMYVLQGRPNPSTGDQTTEPLTIQLIGGQTREITLRAK